MKTKEDCVNKFSHININQVKYRHSGNWFDKSALRFFDSVLCDTVFYIKNSGEGYFVSSEKCDSKTPRMFTVRKVNDLSGKCEVITDSDFQQFKHTDEAYTYIYNKLKESV